MATNDTDKGAILENSASEAFAERKYVQSLSSSDGAASEESKPFSLRRILDLLEESLLVLRGETVVHANPAFLAEFPVSFSHLPATLEQCLPDLSGEDMALLVKMCRNSAIRNSQEADTLELRGLLQERPHHFQILALSIRYEDQLSTLLIVRDRTLSEKKDEELQRQSIELVRRVSQLTNELDAANRLLEEVTVTDLLTRTLNRRRCLELINLEIGRVDRYKGSLSLIMFDIDKFSDVNDIYGQEVGDAILQRLASMVSKRIREVDHLSRWGNDEFIILMPETDPLGALTLANRIREDVRTLSIPSVERITISLGVAGFHKGINGEQFIKYAEKALAEAKSSGRDRVEMAN